jgi:TolA-binding protein
MVLAISTASGCVTQRDQQALEAKADKTEKDLAQARADLDKTRSDLDATRQRLDNALRANADSSSEVLSSRERLNDVGGRVDEVQRGVEDLKRDVAASRTEIYARLDDLKRAQQPPATPAPPPIAVPADKAAHFAQLRDAYTKRDGPTLRALGPEYVNRYPTDEHADEALFFLGDGDLRDGRPSSALGHFNRLLKLFPRSKVLDRTLFDMGEAYLLMHDCANAKTAYEACAKRFATQKPGIDSKAKLQTIAKNPPGLCAPQ